jgi:large subunit ribosomal protein L27
MAKTKAAGTTRLGRDSKPKYLGVKLYEGQKVRPGMIIVKQRGSKFFAGQNVKKGADDTLYSLKEGTVKFGAKKKRNFDGSKKLIKTVSVI